MKQFYIILGQTKSAAKFPILTAGWTNNTNEILISFKKLNPKCIPLYGAQFTLWKFFKYFVFHNKSDFKPKLIKDLK